MLVLKELRNKKGKTLKQVAEDLSIHLVTYQNYEAGRRQPDIETLKRLADYFNTTVDYIVGYKNEHFIDVSLLSNTHIELINKIANSTEHSCELLLAYFDGLKTK